jgi:hypothetical protein
MQQGAGADPATLWHDIDSFDVAPLPHIDPMADLTLESDYSFDFVYPTNNSHSGRQPYGHGLEARRSAPYRSYPMCRSPVLHFLHLSYGTVTKEMLLNMIRTSLRRCPESARPAPPTRAQRRMKAGLVAWLDENATFMMCFLHSPMAGP